MENKMNKKSKGESQISELATLISTRLQDISDRKSQGEVAEEVGFVSKNVLSIIKRGDTKLPLDRVEPLAKALDLDLRTVMLMALRQYYSDDTIAAIREVFLDDLTKTEHEIITIARKSFDTTASLSHETRELLKEVFADNRPAGV